MDNIEKHILVVDDDDRIRNLLKEYLNDNKFIVSTAVDSEDAIKKISYLKFDLIVLDVMNLQFRDRINECLLRYCRLTKFLANHFAQQWVDCNIKPIVTHVTGEETTENDCEYIYNWYCKASTRKDEWHPFDAEC